MGPSAREGLAEGVAVTLDITTPRGLATLTDEKRAARIIERALPHVAYIKTPSLCNSSIDGFLVHRGKGEIFAAIEQKSRYNLPLSRFRTTFGDRWLVTHKKLTDARDLAVKLGVPLVGVLYLVQDRTVLVKRLAESNGQFCATFNVRRTETQAGVNGGWVERDNAFIDMSRATVYEGGDVTLDDIPAMTYEQRNLRRAALDLGLALGIYDVNALPYWWTLTDDQMALLMDRARSRIEAPW